MSEKKVIIFGTGDIAQIAGYYFEREEIFKVVAYTVDRDYTNGLTEFENKPLVPFDEIEESFPPAAHDMFIAVSYLRMNRVREKKFNEARQKGFSLASYVSPHCTYLSQFKI